MRKPAKHASRICLAVSLLSALLTGTAHGADTVSCQESCTADLKKCRKQAEQAANTETYPLIADSSTRSNYANGMGNLQIGSKPLPTSPNEEIARRRMERNEQCTTAEKNCRNRCSSEQKHPRGSVVFK